MILSSKPGANRYRYKNKESYVSLDNASPHDINYKTICRLAQKFAAIAMYLFPFHITKD